MKKKLVLLCTSIIICIAILEFSPFILSPIKNGNPWVKSFETKQDKLYNFKQEGEITRYEALHPYFSFVFHPGIDTLYTYNSWGLPGPEPLQKKEKGKLKVCILGGSVAGELWYSSRNIIDSMLSEETGKEIVIVCLAWSGYKQPQQLIQLTYLIQQGAEYDLVINLDGYNEVALSYAENAVNGVNPHFPRNWGLYSQKALDIPTMIQLAKLMEIRQNRIDKKESWVIFEFSNIATYLWKIQDMDLQHEYAIETSKLLKLGNRGLTFQGSGPPFNIDSVLVNVSRAWAKASIQINDLCKQNNIQYYHFLQPNQYTGNKEMSVIEMKYAYYKASNDYQLAVQNGYPLLINQGKKLVNQKVRFTDLTKIWINKKETRYIDVCCHINKTGMDEIAIAIIQQINRQ